MLTIQHQKRFVNCFLSAAKSFLMICFGNNAKWGKTACTTLAFPSAKAHRAFRGRRRTCCRYPPFHIRSLSRWYDARGSNRAPRRAFFSYRHRSDNLRFFLPMPWIESSFAFVFSLFLRVGSMDLPKRRRVSCIIYPPAAQITHKTHLFFWKERWYSDSIFIIDKRTTERR